MLISSRIPDIRKYCKYFYKQWELNKVLTLGVLDIFNCCVTVEYEGYCVACVLHPLRGISQHHRAGRREEAEGAQESQNCHT